MDTQERRDPPLERDLSPDAAFIEALRFVTTIAALVALPPTWSQDDERE